MASTNLASTFTGRTVACVGRNYAAHARELGNAVPSEPFFFLKPASAVVAPPGPVRLPRGAGAQHEVELAVEIGAPAFRLASEADAAKVVRGYRMAVDVTARAWQQSAKDKGLPWTKAKGAFSFLPLGPLLPDPGMARLWPSLQASGEVWLSVNGKEKQRARLSTMIHSPTQLLVHLTSFMMLEPGDLLLTGTPSGVSELQPGDVVEFGGVGDAQRATCADWW